MLDIRRGPGRFGQDLTPRERFNRTMHYQHVDYVSHLEFGYWSELKETWLQEGHLPASFRQADDTIPDRLVEEYFGIEQFETFDARTGALPPRPIEVIERTPDRITYRDALGVLRQEQTTGTHTIPHFLEFPIRDRATWEAFRDEFLDVMHPERTIPEDELDARERMSRTTTNPVSVYFGSFIGWIRDWTGFETLAYMSVDDPDLLEEMVAHVAGMLLDLLPVVLVRGQFDAAHASHEACDADASPVWYRRHLDRLRRQYPQAHPAMARRWPELHVPSGGAPRQRSRGPQEGVRARASPSRRF